MEADQSSSKISGNIRFIVLKAIITLLTNNYLLCWFNPNKKHYLPPFFMKTNKPIVFRKQKIKKWGSNINWL